MQGVILLTYTIILYNDVKLIAFMNKLILVRVGKYNNPDDTIRVLPEEQERVGKVVRDTTQWAWVDIRTARILATDNEFAQETAFGISAVNELNDSYKSHWGIPTSDEIYNTLPSKSSDQFTTSIDILDYMNQVTKAMRELRRRFREIEWDGIIILVWSFPTVWGIWVALWVDLPEYRNGNYSSVLASMNYWATYILDFPNK